MSRTLHAAAASFAFVSPAIANIMVGVDSSVGGSSVANSINVTTTDYAWNGAQLLVELSQGSVVNLDAGLGGVDYSPTQAQLNAFPALAFDTYVGRIDKFDQPAGGAYELGNTGAWNLGPTDINVQWHGDLGTKPPSNQLPIANLVFSDDAQGTWSILLAEPFTQTVALLNGSLIDGVLIGDFVPGDLNIDGFTGIDDLNIVLGQWNNDASDDPRSDPSGDNYVGIEDLNFVLSDWNAGSLQQPWPENTTADSNGDGFVGLGDLDLILSNWHQNVTPGELHMGDFSGDGFVGFDDMSILYGLWNTGTPPSAVPEPATLALLSLASTTLLKRRLV